MKTTAASVAAVLALALAGAAIAGTPSGYRDATQHRYHPVLPTHPFTPPRSLTIPVLILRTSPDRGIAWLLNPS